MKAYIKFIFLWCLLVLGLSVLIVNLSLTDQKQRSQLTPEQIKKQTFIHNINCTYKIIVFDKTGDGLYQMNGTGTAIGLSQNFLLTAKHVIHVGQFAKICIYDKNGNYLSGIHSKCTKVCDDNDLALIESETPIPDYFNKIPSHSIEVGDKLYVIGAAMGFYPNDIRSGWLTSKNFLMLPGKYISSVSIAEGDSGCGIYSEEDNALLGIVIAKFGIADELWCTVFIPIQDVVKFLEK